MKLGVSVLTLLNYGAKCWLSHSRSVGKVIKVGDTSQCSPLQILFRTACQKELICSSGVRMMF